MNGLNCLKQMRNKIPLNQVACSLRISSIIDQGKGGGLYFWFGSPWLKGRLTNYLHFPLLSFRVITKICKYILTGLSWNSKMIKDTVRHVFNPYRMEKSPPFIWFACFTNNNISESSSQDGPPPAALFLVQQTITCSGDLVKMNQYTKSFFSKIKVASSLWRLPFERMCQNTVFFITFLSWGSNCFINPPPTHTHPAMAAIFYVVVPNRAFSWSWETSFITAKSSVTLTW